MIQMRQGLQNILDQLNQQQWQPQVILGLNRGGCIPAIYLSHKLNVPHHVLNVSLRDHADTPDLHTLEKVYAWQKRILIVDDINDTGKTINNLMEDWRSGCLPNDPSWKDIWNKNVKFATVYDNIGSKCRVTMDFCGEEITKSKKEWIVFPYESWWM